MRCAGIVPAAIALAALASTASAQPDFCSMEALRARSADLPAALLAEPGEDPADVLARAFGCDRVSVRKRDRTYSRRSRDRAYSRRRSDSDDDVLLSRIFRSLRSVFEDGLLPVPLVPLTIESVPAGARVTVNGAELGLTTVQALINEAALETLRLEMQGFSPCEFSQGAYQANAARNVFGTFRCDLTAAPDR
jgi:hypothetical protein